MSAGRHPRHRAINEIIAQTLRSVGVPVELEPVGLLRGDGKRPDGATLVPWSHGRHLLLDFTCPDTLAPSHLSRTSFLAGAAASAAEINKTSKYGQLLHTHSFAPVGVETFGVWGPSAEDFLKALSIRLVSESGDSRSGYFFRQRVDLALQRSNALAVLETLLRRGDGSEPPDSSSWPGPPFLLLLHFSSPLARTLCAGGSCEGWLLHHCCCHFIMFDVFIVTSSSSDKRRCFYLPLVVLRPACCVVCTVTI